MTQSSNSKGVAADRTIVILSRGARLAPMFRATALELARHYRVVVLMYNRTEHEIWRTVPGIVCVDLQAEIRAEVARHQSDLAERTKVIESEIRMPLYKAASNYLLYRRFAREYHHSWPPFYDSEQHMMEEYVGSYGVLSRILDEYRPVLILHEAIDLVTTVVALAVCYRRQIFNWGLILAPAMGDGAMILYYGLRRLNFMCQYLASSPHLITRENRLRARALITKARSQGLPTVSHVETRRSALAHPLLSVRQLLRAGATRSPALLLERLRNWRWLERRLEHAIPQQPFILYLMHLQPEASTSSQSPRWIDQERIIEQVAVNAPHGIHIVVKENPQCYGWRGERYFGPLAAFENVHLIHPLVPTETLLRRANALLTITGSAGMESILLGTRVAVLGRPFYADAPGVRKLDLPEQIFSELADPSWLSPTPTEIETFVAAYLQSTHDLGEVRPGKKWPAPETLGPRLAKAVRETLNFVDAHHLRPQQFDPGYPLAFARRSKADDAVRESNSA
jgi:hypothetical protein